jgi:hypothetical protein
MVPPNVRVDLDIEVVLQICYTQICYTDENRGADEAIHKAAGYRGICEAAREHRGGSNWHEERPEQIMVVIDV